jgi:1,4-dihydroxy-2-naphthoyl-CoA hydrolase
MKSMNVYKTDIKLHDTDAAGLMFFGSQLKIINDSLNVFLAPFGFGYGELFKTKSFYFPVVHVESDYKSSLFVGDPIEVHTRLDKIGQTSLTFSYKILGPHNKLAGTASTVHVTVDKSYKKILIPSDFRTVLEEILKKQKKI